MLRKIKPVLLGVAMGLVGAGCQVHSAADSARGPVIHAADLPADVKEAVAVLHGTQGNEKVMGVVRFSDTGVGVKVSGEVTGLPPNTQHGFHIHEFGDCTDMVKAMSAGGHYNPDGHQHGAPGPQTHAGDMGNLDADASGTAKINVTLPDATITGKNAILGRSVIVHIKADDLKTQPSGNSGDRIACGVIGVAQVKKQ